MSQAARKWSDAKADFNAAKSHPVPPVHMLVSYELVKSGPNKGQWAIVENGSVIGYTSVSPY